MSPDKRSADPIRIAAWTALAVVATAVVFARVRLLGLPLERDEGEYAYTGQLMLAGVPPYQLAYSMKFPGTSAAYAVLMSIFGESAWGIHLGLVVVNLMTTGLVLILGRRILGEVAGIAAAAAYLVLSLMPHLLATAAHATHFVVLFSVAGIVLLNRGLDRKSVAFIFASGCSFGFALLMKQPGVFFALFGVLYLCAREYRQRTTLREILRRGLLFVVGVAAPVLLTFLVLWKAGVFPRFWFWTITYAERYGSQVSFGEGLHIFGGHFLGSVGTAWPIWGIALLGFFACIAMPGIRTRAGFLITFAFFSMLAVCPGFYFRPHYFILLLPAVSLMAGTAVTAACEEANKVCLAAFLMFGASLIWPLWAEADFFFQRPLPEANRMINGTNPFPESIKIGEYIRDHSAASDTIAVLGSEPQIYFYAGRRSATGYIYTYGLMEPQPYARQMQQEMIDEIEAARPKFLVLVVVNKSWLAGPDSDQSIFRWADSYCANYEEVGLINISDQGTDYYLSGRPSDVKPTTEHILIFRRKT